MWNRLRAPLCAVIATVGFLAAGPIVTGAAAQDKKDDEARAVKPAVAALLKQSTDVYKKMNTYRHTAKWTIVAKGEGGEVREDVLFTLALERPNRFVYKMDSKSKFFAPVAAYSDGTTFVNFKAKLQPVPSRQYTKTAAPVSYAGINIVDGVEFQPIGTYIIALMLQGDALADKDVRAAFEKATLRPALTENGKKWQVVDMPFGSEGVPISLYFGSDDHLVGKATQKGEAKGPDIITEIIDAIKINKSIDPAVFQYVLPPDAKQVEHFSAPQRPDDARVLSRRSLVARR